MVRTDKEFYTDIAVLNLDVESKKQLLENIQDTFKEMNGNGDVVSQLKEDNEKLKTELKDLKDEYIKRFTEPHTNNTNNTNNNSFIKDTDIIETTEKKYINITNI